MTEQEIHPEPLIRELLKCAGRWLDRLCEAGEAWHLPQHDHEEGQ